MVYFERSEFWHRMGTVPKPVVSKNTNELRTGAVIRKKEDRV